MSDVDTFGTVIFVDGAYRNQIGRFHIDCEPNARMLLKRHFPRIAANGKRLTITATDEVCYLLRWFLGGFPLAMTADVRALLDQRADRYLSARTFFRAAASGQARVTDPVHLKVELREYQQLGVHIARTSKGLLLADEMGLGKTLQAIGLIAGEPAARPALVVCELHLMRQWAAQFRRAAPSLVVHTIRKGSPYNVATTTNLLGEQSSPRGALSQPFDPAAVPDVLIIPYSRLDRWGTTLSRVIRGVVYDEVQSLRRGEQTSKGAAASEISDAAEYRLGLSGTPVYNYGAEMHSVMRFLAPGALGSRDEFLREWCVASNRDTASVRDPAALGDHLRGAGVMLRRTREDVGRELPPLSKIPVEVPNDRKALEAMQGRAAELARLILDKRPDIRAFERLRAAEELSGLVRQATGIAKAPYVAAFIVDLIQQGRRPVVFGWHHEVYALWKTIIEQAEVVNDVGTARKIRAGWFTGRQSANEKQFALDQFLRGDLDVLIMSLRSGAGVDGLQHATDTVVFGELDWSPKIHDQCVTRVQRDGQTLPTVAYYTWTDAGSDPIVLDVLGAKRAQSDPMFDANTEEDPDDTDDPPGDERHASRLAEHVIQVGLFGRTES